MKFILDELNYGRAINFFTKYDLEMIMGDGERRSYLGEKSSRVCRFCKGSNRQVTFRNDAHALPQFLGNRNLLSYFECDECNILLSTYEDSFAKFLGSARTLLQMKGKSKRVPKYKKNRFEVAPFDQGIQITVIKGNDQIKVDRDNKSIEITTLNHTYIPIHIPKLLVKIGLSMLEPEDLEDFDYARNFIIDSSKDSLFSKSDEMRVFAYFIPGPNRFTKPFAALWKRIADKSSCLVPARQVTLHFGNFGYQFILPFAKSDENLRGEKIDVPLFPLLIDNDYFEQFGKYQELIFNLGSCEIKKDEKQTLSFSYQTHRSS